MSKSGQPATKADSGGQRPPKSSNDSAGNEKKASPKSSPAKKEPAKKPGS